MKLAIKIAPGTMIRLVATAALLLILTVTLSVAYGNVRIRDVSALKPFERGYELRYQSITSGHDIQNVLFVYSTVPETDQFYQAELQKFDYLSQIITSYWNVSVQIIDHRDYQVGDIANYDAVVVINDYFKPLSKDFMTDLRQAEYQEIVWAGYDAAILMSQVLHDESYQTAQPRRFPTALYYKGVTFPPRELESVYPLPSPRTDSPIPVEVVATYDTEDEQHLALAVDVDERVLILPFRIPAYYEVDTYSLIFLDTLHRAFGHTDGTRQALIRLEDVNAYTYGNNNALQEVYQYLADENIPFQIALIAHYTNPNDGTDLELYERERFFKLLKVMQGEGLATVVSHGYDHQVGDEISGIGFELWDGKRNAPLEDDSKELVLNLIGNINRAMQQQGVPVPDIWETPHYALSDLDSAVLNAYYPLRYEHIPHVGSLPFIAEIDGTIYIPENLGFIFNSVEDVEVVEQNLIYLSVFESPVASFFWHPWRNRAELVDLVTFIEAHGYDFVGAYDLIDTSDSAYYAKLKAYQHDYTHSFEYRLYVRRGLLVMLTFIVLIPGCLLFIHNMHSVRKNFKGLKQYHYTVDELFAMSKALNRPLPQIAILVPARNEGLVIGNTVRRLANMDYPKECYWVIIIVDERELDDDVERFTKDVVHETAAIFHEKYGLEFIGTVEVPKWYSGKFGSWEQTFTKSTKGRALNYTLQMLYSDPKFEAIEMFGVLDADGRLDTDVLKEVAYKRMVNGSRVLQGPVFQVSNFAQVSLVGVAAGLELAMHHLTELPNRIKAHKVQFLAGTNYFIEKELMIKVGGWDQQALVEDAELGLRLYVEQGVKADWLSCPELEQTPPSFAVYRRQRERWVRGHLALIKTIRRSPISLSYKITFLKIILTSQFRFVIDFGMPILMLVLMLLGVYEGLTALQTVFSIILFVMSIMILDTYGYMFRLLSEYIDKNMKWYQKAFISFKLLIMVPIFMIIQSFPRVEALYNYTLKPGETAWYKTERTREVATET